MEDPISDYALQMIANGLEIPSIEAILSIKKELEQHGTTYERVMATRLRELRGIPNADNQ